MDETIEEAAPEPGASKLKPLLIVAVCLVAGLGVGGKVVAPMLSPADSTVAKAPEEEAAKEPPKYFRLDNVIVNPAGSGGQRYVIVSVAFEVPDVETQERLTRAEIQLRDMVTGLLERQTMTLLTQAGARDSLRAAIGVAIKPFLSGKKVTIYVPQFLIQ